MTMSPSNIVTPHRAMLILGYAINSYPCVVDKIDAFAGEAIGSAIVRYPGDNANNATRRMGDTARITIGGQTVFRGSVGHGPFEVNPDQDEVQLALFDDKWRMSATKIGKPGIGTVGPEEARTGFTDVGYELIFNRDGKPDKMAGASSDFSMASTAVFWTLRDVLTFVFTYYVSADVATLPAAQVAHAAWDRKPSNLNLFGMSPVAAVNTLAQLAGESWALIPAANASTYRSVRPGVGTIRPLRLFMPSTGASVAGATEGTVSDINAALSIENCRDAFYVASAEIVKERTYSISNGLLAARGSSPIAGYAHRFGVDVTKYADNSLGASREAGSRPKVWKKKLSTRLVTTESGQHYATAAEILANPTLEANEAVEIPLWISADGTVGNMKRMSGGYRIDTEHNLIDIQEKPEVLADGDRNKKVELKDIDWANVGLWVTVATVLESSEIVGNDDGDYYLPEPMTEVVKRTDLVPERRHFVALPTLTGDNPHAYDSIAVSAEEKYVDVTARLTDALSALSDSSPEIESPITATLPMFPVWQIGDRVAIQGRPSGATGREVITKITYNVYEEFSTVIEATNVMVAVDPEKFVGKQR